MQSNRKKLSDCRGRGGQWGEEGGVPGGQDEASRVIHMFLILMVLMDLRVSA